MQSAPGKIYTHDRKVAVDGTVSFTCSQDQEMWPWLALHPHHPAVVQTQNYWTAVEGSQALDRIEQDKWTAMVWTDWEFGSPDVSQAVRGEYARATDESFGFVTSLFDCDDQLIVRMRGKGVVFRTRDFEKWREPAKEEARRNAIAAAFAYANREALALEEGERRFLSPLADVSPPKAVALITKENGFMPGNRFIGGSGDHVNATHLSESARQMLTLLMGGTPHRITGGEMAMNRYVELGTPFTLTVSGREDGTVHLTVSQLDRDCSEVTLRFETG
ncbi:hypothetical protein [Altererythrobacter sp. MF3-039]|uniref:hypothetical protein n=1 Tax=Altererythrobacter sp. MF3-039 TaxID=3252901 RepID=UPI00390CCE4C